MQIRLTVVDPLGPPSEPRGPATACDVLVTAPAGTALAAVASGLASAVGGDGGAAPLERGRESGGGAVVLYAGEERLDAQRCTLGEPPLIDGVVLSVGAPAEPGPVVDESAHRLHVVAGPDAGGVHFLHGGRIHIGRSADADIPLDDPDVSRLHCAVTVTEDGRVSVADLGSTNGTTLDGTRVGERPARLTPGALLRVGESALRLTPPGGVAAGPGVLGTVSDGEGRVRVVAGEAAGAAAGSGGAGPAGGGPAQAVYGGGTGSGGARAGLPGSPAMPHPRVACGGGAPTAFGVHGSGPVQPPFVPGQGGAPRIESGSGETAGYGGTARGAGGHGGGYDLGARGRASGAGTRGGTSGGTHDQASPEGLSGGSGTREGTPVRGTDVPGGVPRRGGLTAWARRLAGGRGEQTGAGRDRHGEDHGAPGGHGADGGGGGLAAENPPLTGARLPEKWPDPAALLLTALGPGTRLWERGPEHPEALTVRLGTADRAAPDGSGLLPAVPVTAGLGEVGALGLAGPRARLLGLARAVVAQLAALHSPDTLELVLISADRSRSVEERTADWSWLGWLPHVRPGHGQDCRLLLAYDRDQAAARADELLRRLEDHAADTGIGDRARVPGAGAEGEGPGGQAARCPSRARDAALAAAGFAGPYTVVLVDGDPGGPGVREAVLRLALEGPAAGIHVVCLAETEAASPASPVTETYQAACGVSPVFRECGAVALLSGDVATALRLLRVARAGSAGRPADGTGRRPSPESRRHQARATDPADHDAPTGTTDHPPSGATGHAYGDRTGHHHTGSAGPGRPGSAGGTGGPADRPRAEAARSADTSQASRTHGVRVGHPPANAGRASSGKGTGTAPGTPGPGTSHASVPSPITPGTVATVDAVSVAWAERFARALAPLRVGGSAGERHPRVSAPLPRSARLLDELGLARATPASLMARWADAADVGEPPGGRASAVLGAGPRGPVCADLAADGPHLLIEGPSGSGRTELLRSVAASLAAAERPDRLGIALVDGRDGGGHSRLPGDGLGVCTDLPHVRGHLEAHDPVRMREFAQSLSAELKRRAELLGHLDFVEWHTRHQTSGRIGAQRSAKGTVRGTASPASGAPSGSVPGAEHLDAPQGSTPRHPAPARLVVVVDDLDALLSPPLGSPGRPAAGSVVRALEAVAREGARLGVHLVAATAGGTRTAETELARAATLRVTLETPAPGPDEPAPGRGVLAVGGNRSTGDPSGRSPVRTIPFQAGRVTGRIPRTATLRPTVVPLDWTRMGDPPTRRPVRELGNGPTDLALLASALDRAARSVSATQVASHP
jgi:hypothetical protein